MTCEPRCGAVQDRRGAPLRRIYNLPQAHRARKSIFATAPYEADESGVLVAVLPERCALAGPGERCSLFVDHYRPRKTGPCFPLAVVGCCVHPGRRYTLYPPGHIPFGRQAAVSCSSTGPLLREGATGQPVWAATLFGAALDAAGDVRWPEDSPCDDERRRRTQGSRLTWAGRLLGVHPEVDARAQELIATRLRVPTMTLRSAARGWGRDWMTRGAAVLSVLGVLRADDGLLDRILSSGAVAQLWPWPERWDQARRTWVRSGRPERPVTAVRGSRAPPPTKSPGAERARFP